MLSSFTTDRLQSVGMNAKKKRKRVSSAKGKGFENLKEWGGLFIEKQKYEEGLYLECTHRNASLSQCFKLNFLGTWKLFRKWRKHLFGCNIRPAIYLFFKERFRPRPNASGYAEITHLIFASTRIRFGINNRHENAIALLRIFVHRATRLQPLFQDLVNKKRRTLGTRMATKIYIC